VLLLLCLLLYCSRALLAPDTAGALLIVEVVSGFVTQHSPCGFLAVGNYVETTGSARQEFTYQIIIFPWHLHFGEYF